MSSTGGSVSSYIGGKFALVLAVVLAGAGAVVIPTVTGGSDSSFTCDTTLSGSGDIASSLSDLPAGETLCLDAGSYSYTAGTISKSSMTTVRAAPGVSRDDAIVTTPVDLSSSHNLTFETLSLAGGEMGAYYEPADEGIAGTDATNVTLTDIKFTGSFCIYETGNNTSRGILISYSSFIDLGQSCSEGRLGIDGLRDTQSVTHTQSYDQGVVIDHNLFQGPGIDASHCSDGIQGTDGAVGYTISNNEFKYINQNSTNQGTASFDCDSGTPGDASDDTHVDPYQPWDSDFIRLTGNFFNLNTTGLQGTDCAAIHMDVENNVWYGNGEYADQASMAGGAATSIFAHNVVDGVGGANFRTIGNTCNGDTGTVEDNVITGVLTGNAPTGTVDYNLTAVASLRGTHGVNSSSPTYASGDAPLAAWADYDLDALSPGYHAGSTGTSIGINP